MTATANDLGVPHPAILWGDGETLKEVGERSRENLKVFLRVISPAQWGAVR